MLGFPATQVRDTQLSTMAQSSEKKLMPNALVVKTTDGSELVLPADKNENSIANKILAAQIRQALTAAIRKYKDMDVPLTPKELKDLADAGKSVAQFSGEVYKENEEIPKSRHPDAMETKVEEVDFSEKKPDA